MGLLDYPELIELYQASDAFAMMSTAESQSLSLMQAMASGLPCIVANTRALPEYIDGRNGRLVAPGDVYAMARELLALARDPSLDGDLGSRATADVNSYAADAIGRRWQVVYDRVLMGRDPACAAAEVLR